MITASNSNFFNIFAGKNAPLYESIIITLYDELYRASMGFLRINRIYLRELVERELKKFNWEKYEENQEFSNIGVMKQHIISKLEENGWIEAKWDTHLLDHIYTFTRTGRKIAQVLHQMHSHRLSTRHRNVRSTISFLEMYKDKGDPYDLIDALESSDYIVSDLMDQANEIREYNKQLIKDALEDINKAGEGFVSFLEKDFYSTIEVPLTEDSVSRHAGKIIEIANSILVNEKELVTRNEKLLTMYPSMQKDENHVEEFLEKIKNNVKNARDHSIPELVNATNTLVKNTKMILKQASSLFARSGTSVEKIALSMKEMDTVQKDRILEKIGNSFNIINATFLDPQKVIVKERTTKTIIQSIITEAQPPNPETIRQVNIRNAIRKMLGYTSADVEQSIISLLENEQCIINGHIQIDNYKSLSTCLHAASVATHMDGYKVIKTGKTVRNQYTQMDEFFIAKENEN